MNITRSIAVCCSCVLLTILMAAVAQSQDQKKSSKYACSEPDPQSLCTADNTCGSASNPCTVDVKKVGNGASATPSIPKAKGNALFCVKTGTTVTWSSTKKNTGIVLDFGSASPFDPPDEPLMGGSAKPVSTVAKKEGCYKFTVGACVAEAIYGMCGSGNAEVIITSK